MNAPTTTRRALFKGAAAITAATAIPVSAIAQSNPERELDAILTIAKHTGLTVDDLVQWLECVDVERIAQNVQAPPHLKWDKYGTHAAMQALCVGVGLSIYQDSLPMQGFMVAQIKTKGVPETVKGMLARYDSPSPVLRASTESEVA